VRRWFIYSVGEFGLNRKFKGKNLLEIFMVLWEKVEVVKQEDNGLKAGDSQTREANLHVKDNLVIIRSPLVEATYK